MNFPNRFALNIVEWKHRLRERDYFCLFILRFLDNAVYRRALLRSHGIRDCFVKIDRMSVNIIKEMAPKKKLILASPQDKTFRSNVSWLPNSSQVKKNSAGALSALDTYRDRNGVLPRVGKKNVIRQRAKSMFVEKNSQSNEVKYTMDDMHVEFKQKYNSPNRGLKPGTERRLSKLQPEHSQCQNIYEELQVKLATKRAAAAAVKTPPPPPPLPQSGSLAKPKLSWLQLKALETKKYPVVQCSVPAKPAPKNLVFYYEEIITYVIKVVF